MNDASKVKPNHIQRAAYVYIRQSSPAQVETTASPPLADMIWLIMSANLLLLQNVARPTETTTPSWVAT